MRTIFPLLVLTTAILAPSNPASAQAVTSPDGFLSTEGANWFALRKYRIQSIDGTHVGKNLTFQSLALRRDGTYSSTGSVKMNATLQLGLHANLSRVVGDLSQTFAGSPTTVFSGTVTWPDWSSGSGGPYPFDVVFPFTSKYTYFGSTYLDFVWDLDLTKNTTTFGRYIDQTGPPMPQWTTTLPTQVGGGCQGFSHLVRFWNNGPSATRHGMFVVAGGATTGLAKPPAAPVLMAVDVKQSSLQVPGWCASIYVQPTLLLPIGPFTYTQLSTNPSYTVHQTPMNLYSAPYSTALEGVSFYTQMVTSHSGSIWLSNALKSVMPKNSNTGVTDAATMIVWNGQTAPFPYMGFTIPALLK